MINDLLSLINWLRRQRLVWKRASFGSNKTTSKTLMIINKEGPAGLSQVGGVQRGERPQTSPPGPLTHVSPTAPQAWAFDSATISLLIKIISMLIHFYGKILFQSQTIKLIDSFGHFSLQCSFSLLNLAEIISIKAIVSPGGFGLSLSFPLIDSWWHLLLWLFSSWPTVWASQSFPGHI